jgi:hypothetical protein
MKIFYILASLWAAVIEIAAQNVATPGTYHIINTVLDPSGNKLAVTFNGGTNPITVTPLTNATTQQVSITIQLSICVLIMLTFNFLVDFN